MRKKSYLERITKRSSIPAKRHVAIHAEDGPNVTIACSLLWNKRLIRFFHNYWKMVEREQATGLAHRFILSLGKTEIQRGGIDRQWQRWWVKKS